MKLLLHPRVEGWLARIARIGSGSYLFYGPAGVGKRSAATLLCQQLNCPDGGGDGCGICRQIEVGNFPGLVVLEPDPSAKSRKIGIAQVQKLQEELSMSAYYEGKARLVVIDLGDNLTLDAQNCLLKTIEEPPLNTVVVLLSNDPDLLLPTVRSRLQAIYFAPIAEDKIDDYLQTTFNLDQTQSKKAARLSRGQMGIAVNLAKIPANRDKLAQIAGLARRTFEQNTFGRLLLVPEILAIDENVDQFLNYLFAAVGSQLRLGKLPAAEASTYLEAIERCGRYIGSNVNVKASLEGLMLELEHSNA